MERADWVAQVVEHLPSQVRGPELKTQFQKKKKKKEKKKRDIEKP
jgi:hypothetical protein